MTITIDESQRQMILLALAHLAIERPGWKYATGEAAKTMDSKLPNGDPELYTRFYDLRFERVTNSLPELPTDETFKKAMGA